MDTGYLQHLRCKLQKRVRRLNSTPNPTLNAALHQFWGFLQSYDVFTGIIEDLERSFPTLIMQAGKIINERSTIYLHNENENAALSYFLIKKCLERSFNEIEAEIGLTLGKEGDIEESYEH